MCVDGIFLSNMNVFSNRYELVALNGQASSWANVKACVAQGSMLGHLFFVFLYYINNRLENLKSSFKRFEDNASIFVAVGNLQTPAATFNCDLTKVSEWSFKWEISVNIDPSKQV